MEATIFSLSINNLYLHITNWSQTKKIISSEINIFTIIFTQNKEREYITGRNTNIFNNVKFNEHETQGIETNVFF